MKLSAALQYENQPRSEADWNKIYLNHDGKFFHAYEWSAWLIKTVACTEEYQQQRGDAKMLQAMLYTTKNSEYIITGFPLDSIGKYIPQYVAMNPVEDGGGDLIIEIELPQEWDGMTQEQMEEAFKEWRSQQPVKEPKGKGMPLKHAERMEGIRSGLFSIMSQVLAWPTESKTPMENAAFIADLKAQLIALL
jgi:hypothetical protein